MGYPVPPARILFDTEDRRELVERRTEFVEEMTKATAAGVMGETTWGSPIDNDRPKDFPILSVRRDQTRAAEVRKALDDMEMAKGVSDSPYQGSRSEFLSKEWTLTNPVSTGLVPFDLEAPAKLLTPRPTPLRNSIPRVKGQGGARRFKVISGFTGTGTGGQTTTQPGITETSTNAGPGGLSYVRGPRCGAAA